MSQAATDNSADFPLTLPLRADLRGHEPYGAPQLEVQVAINVNENPYPVPPQVIAAITAAVEEVAGGLNRYPSRDFLELRTALAKYLVKESGVTVSPETIWAANGSNEIMQHLFTAFGGPGQIALTAVPSYSMYPEYARNTLTDLVQIPRREEDFQLEMTSFLAAIQQHHPSLVVLASPNNPTGTQLPLADLREILDATASSGPGGSATVVVIDEAYAEFRRDNVASALELLADYPQLVVSRTMSKAFGMAGLRLGYAVAHPQIVSKLQVVRLPYHLSELTQAAGVAALSQAEVLQSQVATIRASRDFLVEQLRGMGLQVADSDTNFVMFGVFSDPQRLWQDLLDKGILIRVVGPPGWLRASVGTEAETELFVHTLKEVLRWRKQ